MNYHVNLLFIFDEKYQEANFQKLEEKNCGSKICENLGINYLWFSLAKGQLFSIKIEVNELIEKFAIKEYIPNNFLFCEKGLLENSEDENKNKIDIKYDIKPRFKIDKNQESLIQNNIIENIFNSKYIFSKILGKNFQLLFPKEKIKEYIPLIKKGQFPYVHIFSEEGKNTFFLLVNNDLYEFTGQNFEISDYERIQKQYISWDIYELKISDKLDK